MSEPQTELDIARAMARGDLPSPQKIGNTFLFALRVTGTGKAYRSKLDEFVLRDPKIFLSRDFLERCGAGVPIIVNHPENNILDGDEYKSRAIGSTMLGFRNGDEAWAIGRVYDSDAAAAMESRELSTSPAVVLKKGTSERRELSNGEHLLIEGEPFLLDHLAICKIGVWDKGEGPSGIEIGRSDNMSEEKDGGTELDKVLKALAGKMDDCLTKMDAIKADHTKLSDRLDAIEERDNDRRDRDRDDRRERDDRRRDDRSDRRRARRDEDPEPREPGEARAIAADDCTEDRPDYIARMTDAQARADGCYISLGLRGAPKFLNGEHLRNYRERLLRGVQPYCDKFKTTDLSKVRDVNAFAGIEELILADAAEAALRPDRIGVGHLHMVNKKTDAGHTIHEFYGDPGAWLSYFGGRLQRVVAINTKADPSALTRRIA